ncbi:MAG TPA: hypothetical protein VMF86_14065 [Stellaceae bacterium]|nr:hypothetical protein [Stellaceae bacterium]
MATGSKLLIGEAERRFPVRLRLAVPPDGFGGRLDAMAGWLDATAARRRAAASDAGRRRRSAVTSARRRE